MQIQSTGRWLALASTLAVGGALVGCASTAPNDAATLERTRATLVYNFTADLDRRRQDAAKFGRFILAVDEPGWTIIISPFYGTSCVGSSDPTLTPRSLPVSQQDLDRTFAAISLLNRAIEQGKNVTVRTGLDPTACSR